MKKHAGKICQLSALLLLLFAALSVGAAGAILETGKNRLYARSVPSGNPDSQSIYHNGIPYQYDNSRINVLFLGIDKRGLLDQKTDLSDYESGQADALYLLSYSPSEKNCEIIPIPRNTLVMLKRYGKDGELAEEFFNQICLQYAFSGGGPGGLSGMKEQVSGLFYGIPIHGAFALSLEGVRVAVNRMGGIPIVMPEDLTNLDPSYKKGSKVLLDGDGAFAYAHFRDITTLGSPLQRIERQKVLISEAVQTLKTDWPRALLLTYSLAFDLPDYVCTDLTWQEELYLAKALKDCPFSDAHFHRPEGESVLMTNESGGHFDDFLADQKSLEQITLSVFFRKGLK